MNWNLDDLYKGFDETYDADIKRLETLLADYKTLVKNETKLSDLALLESYLSSQEALEKLATSLFAFASLTTDRKSVV